MKIKNLNLYEIDAQTLVWIGFVNNNYRTNTVHLLWTDNNRKKNLLGFRQHGGHKYNTEPSYEQTLSESHNSYILCESNVF